MAKVKIYTVDYCPYCKKALRLLEDYNADMENIDITDDEAAMRAELMKETGIRTVPQIFIDDEFIGGSDSLVELDREGKLKSMLAS